MRPGIYTALFSFILCANIAFPQAPESNALPPRHFPPNREFHMVNVGLNLSFDMQKRELFGTAVETIVPLRAQYDSIRLDAVDMTIRTVTMGGRQLGFSYDGRTLSIGLGKYYGLDDTLSYTIVYSTFPQKGVFFVEPDSAYPDRSPQVWSQSEMEDARYWYPCHDYPDDFLTSSVDVTVPEDWNVVSNGILQKMSVDNEMKTKDFHWVESKPHVIYLISFVAGKYSIVNDSLGNIPIYYYVEPKYEKFAAENFSHTPDIVNFYSEVTGYPYPWQKLSLAAVGDFTFGGMENVSAITLTDQTMHDKNAEPQVESTGLVAHETAHQWFGDLLTCRSWSNAWLNEGFATYFDALYTRHAFGEDEFDYQMYDNQNEVLRADREERRPTVYDRYNDPVDLFSVYIYPRGADILNMLRGFLGDKLFFRAIQHYVHEYKHQNVDTHDFENAVEEATGYNLYWFFDEWVYKAGHPVYDVSYKYDMNSHEMVLNVRQTQTVDSLTPVYRMPVDLLIESPSQKISCRVWVDSSSNTYTFNLSEAPSMVNFDENDLLLKELDFKKSVTELAYQLEHDTNVAGRIWAVDQLAETDSDDAARPLIDALKNDPFWGVRQECAKELSRFRSSPVENALRLATGDKDARVAEEAINSLASFKDASLSDLLEKIYDSQTNYFVRAAAVRTLAAVAPGDAGSVIRKALEEDSYGEVIRSAALRALAKVDSSKALDEAMEMARYGEPQTLRLLSMREISRLAPDNEAMRILTSYLTDPYIWARLTAMYSLGRVGDKSVIPLLQEREKLETDGRLKDAARRAIESISKRESR